MFIEDFLKDTNKRSELQKALSILNSIGFFQVLLEMSYIRSGTLGSTDILETATYQRGFGLGYFQSIDDLFNFNDRFTKIVSAKTNVEPDWGAKAALIGKGMTLEEIENAKRKLREHSKSS